MGDQNETPGAVRQSYSRGRNSIRFAPLGRDACSPEGRAFEVRGEYVSNDLTAAVLFLTISASQVYRGVDMKEGNLRIILQPKIGWLISLPFYRTVPPEMALINEKIGEQGDATVLAYTIFMLCWHLGWSVADVTIEEAPIG